MDVDVDVQGIICKTGSQSSLVWFACSLSVLIDPDQLYKLSPKESKSLNELPVVQAWQETVNKHKQKWDDHKAKLDHANITCQATFSHIIEGAVPKHHHLQEKLELFQDQMMEAKWRYNRAVYELCNEK